MMAAHRETHVPEGTGQDAELATHASFLVHLYLPGLEIFLNGLHGASFCAGRVFALEAHDGHEFFILNIYVVDIGLAGIAFP